jgi:hypothetical protein
MGYVALSRVRSLDGIKLLGINKTALEVNPAVCDLDKELEKLSDISSKKVSSMGRLEKKKKQKEFVENNIEKKEFD